MARRDVKALYLAHGDELGRFLMARVRCRHTADDLVQETFLRFAQQPDNAGEGNARSYLFRTAVNLVTDHFRREERRRTHTMPAEFLAGIPDDAPPAERVAEARQRLEFLLRAMEELPMRTREIFVLHRFDGLSYAEVARRLGISESSVQKHLARALAHAVRRLEEY